MGELERERESLRERESDRQTDILVSQSVLEVFVVGCSGDGFES